mmetsp:Transcript_806/g.1754  ORF Transcript_806/g.1754 Transcript_806/m.1754 type:complete len:982 (-) Transcript_806:56-3001(-)
MIFTREETELLTYDVDAFFYFAGAMLTVLLVPWTSYLVWAVSRPRGPEEEDFSGKGRASAGVAVRRCTTAVMEEKRRKQNQAAQSLGARLSRGVGPQVFAAGFLWVCLFAVLWRLKDTSPELRSFDPFAILGVAPGSDVKEIKKAYRKQSLLHHPDKDKNNPLAPAMFQQVTKAYAALTDEVGRRNYEKYGNPDGPVNPKVSIALHPDLLVSKENRLITLCVFFAVLFIVPFSILCCCLRGSQLSTNGVSAETIRVLEACIDSEVRAKDGPGLVAASAEARRVGRVSMQTLIQVMAENFPRPIAANVVVLVNGPACAAAKGSAGASEDKKDRRGLVRRVDEAKGMVHVEVDTDDIRVLPLKFVKAVEPRVHCGLSDRMIRRNALLIWAHMWRLHGHMSPELQMELSSLLKIAGRIGRSMVALAARSCKEGSGNFAAVEGMVHFRRCLVQALDFDSSALLQLPHVTKVGSSAPSLQQVMRGEATSWLNSLKLTDQQRLDIDGFCKHAPQVELSCKVEVEDEENIAEGDLATMTVTLTRKNLAEGEAVGPVHAPFFPMPKFEEWWLLVYDERARSVVTVEAILGNGKEESAKIHFGVHRKGDFRWTVHAMCDSYVGLDVKSTVNFKALSKKEIKHEIFTHPEDREIKTFFEMMMESLEPEAEDDSDSDDDVAPKGKQVVAAPKAAQAPKAAEKQQEEDKDEDEALPEVLQDSSDSDRDVGPEGNFYRIAPADGVHVFRQPKEDPDLRVGTIPRGTIVRGVPSDRGDGWVLLIPGQGAWIRGEIDEKQTPSSGSTAGAEAVVATTRPLECMGSIYEQKLSTLLTTPTPLLFVKRWARRSKVPVTAQDVQKIRDAEDSRMRMMIEEMLRERLGDGPYEELLDKAEELREARYKRLTKALGVFTSQNGVTWYVTTQGAVRGVAKDGSKIKDKTELTEEEIRLGPFRLDETRTCSCIHWIMKDDPQKSWAWSRDDSLKARLTIASSR